MRENLPFVITVLTAGLISLYLLLDPAMAVMGFMQLTYLSWFFKGVIIVLAAIGFGLAYAAERTAFVWLAKVVGKVYSEFGKGRKSRKKKRKEYKVLIEGMRF